MIDALNNSNCFSAGMHLLGLTESELERIHLATLEVLEETGLYVEDSKALEIFVSNGARVESDTKRVKIPSYLVEEAIRSAPSTVTLYGQDPQKDRVLKGFRTGFSTVGEAVQYQDPWTETIRSSVKKDLCLSVRVADALPEIDVVVKTVMAGDVPQQSVQVHHAQGLMTNTAKPILTGPGNGWQAGKIIELCELIAGGKKAFRQRPFLSFIQCPVSPLKMEQNLCQAILTAARHGLVMNVLSMAMAGGSSPVTLAGTVVTHNAEVLGGIALSQLTCKGTPVIYGSATTAMDLRTASAPVGTPESSKICSLVTQLARYYNIPSSVLGGWGSSKCADAQAGHEKTLNMLMPALSGANLIYALGMLDAGMTFSPAQLVMDAEFARMIRQVRKGIVVTDEALAADLIKEVGSFGDYLSQEHTLRYMREHSQPKLIDRWGRNAWKKKGSTSLYARAAEQARHILKTHQPPTLSESLLKDIDAFVKETEKESRSLWG